MGEYDRQKDIAAEGQRAALYHSASEIGRKAARGFGVTLDVGDALAAKQLTIDALVAALEDAGKWLDGQPSRSTCKATSLTELTASIEDAPALARGGK